MNLLWLLKKSYQWNCYVSITLASFLLQVSGQSQLPMPMVSRSVLPVMLGGALYPECKDQAVSCGSWSTVLLQCTNRGRGSFPRARERLISSAWSSDVNLHGFYGPLMWHRSLTARIFKNFKKQMSCWLVYFATNIYVGKK